MKLLCPTCHGKGTRDDPKCIGKPMRFLDQDGNAIPQVACQTCDGTGWVDK